MRAQRLVSGLALGLLLGVLIGLSVSQVVASFIAAIAGLLAVILGVAPLPDEGKLKVNHPQVAAFSIACILSLLAAVYVRTHGLLSPKVSEQIENAKAWTRIGLSPEHAALIVTGAAPSKSEGGKSEAASRGTTQFAIMSALSGVGNVEDTCVRLDPDSLDSSESILRTLRANGLYQLAARIEREPKDSQKILFEYAWKFSCR